MVTLLLIAVTAVIGADYPPDIKRIIDRKKLIVAVVESNHPPFFTVSSKTGKMCGFDVELAEGIAAGLGVELEFNRDAKTFNELVDIVSRHEADIVISKLSLTLTRSKKVLYSNPYIVQIGRAHV